MLEQGPPSVRRFDATRLAKRISQSQEITGQHRVGTVDTVNTDGTIDVDLAGTVIPDVPTVGGVTVGGSVQLLVWQGDLLALAYTGPRGVLGYAQRTSDITGLGAGPTALTGLTTTVDVAAGRRIRVTASVGQWIRSGTLADGNSNYLRIHEDGTQRRVNLYVWYGASFVGAAGVEFSVILTPSAGSHTYELRHLRNSGSHTTTLTASSDIPAFILVEDIGSA